MSLLRFRYPPVHPVSRPIWHLINLLIRMTFNVFPVFFRNSAVAIYRTLYASSPSTHYILVALRLVQAIFQTAFFIRLTSCPFLGSVPLDYKAPTTFIFSASLSDSPTKTDKWFTGSVNIFLAATVTPVCLLSKSLFSSADSFSAKRRVHISILFFGVGFSRWGAVSSRKL